MKWVKKNEYYIELGEWTICKYAPPHFEFALFHNKVNKGFFMTLNEAKIKYESIKND